MLGIQLLSTYPLLSTHAPWRNVSFSTGPHGYEHFSAWLPLSLYESFYLYDRPGLPSLTVTWQGVIVWEGRLEDITIIPGGVRVGAFGWWRGYGDVLITSTYVSQTAQAIVQNVISLVNAVNSTMSSNTALVQNPGVLLSNKIYQDRPASEILAQLALLGDNQTTPRIWEVGVWEDRVLHFRPRGDAARSWFIDAALPDIERTLETLHNSAYAAYQDAANQRVTTAVSSDAQSIARYGLTRQAVVGVQTQTASEATAARDALLDDLADPPPHRGGLIVRRIYDAFGTQWPLCFAHSGDNMTYRNLLSTLSVDVDRIRTFRIAETRYDMIRDELTIIPEGLQYTPLTWLEVPARLPFGGGGLPPPGFDEGSLVLGGGGVTPGFDEGDMPGLLTDPNSVPTLLRR